MNDGPTQWLLLLGLWLALLCMVSLALAGAYLVLFL